MGKLDRRNFLALAGSAAVPFALGAVSSAAADISIEARYFDDRFRRIGPEPTARVRRLATAKDEVFHGITSRHVNAFYSSIVKGLTAKVFRTFLATNVVKEYLKKNDKIKSKSANVKLFHAKLANLEAAIMCNHKRTIPKTFKDALQKKKDMLKKIGQTKSKTAKQKERLQDRKEKIKLAIDLTEKTKDYNLGTSLRNYIDPRVFKAWTNEVGAEWEKLYTAALQKKFLWVKNADANWKKIAAQ